MVNDFQNTPNCVKIIKLGLVISYKILIQDFEVATILGQMIDNV